MSLAIGSDGIQQLYVGSDGVLSVFLGDVLVWESGGPTPMPDFALKFTSPTSGSTFWIQPVGSPSVTPTYEYLTEGSTTWTSYTLGQTVSIPVGGAVYFKASGTNTSTADNPNKYWQLQTSGDVKVEGKFIGLIDENGTLQPTGYGNFRKFFSDANNASHLSLDLDFSGVIQVGQSFGVQDGEEWTMNATFEGCNYSQATFRNLGDLCALGRADMCYTWKDSSWGTSGEMCLSGVELVNRDAGKEMLYGCPSVKKLVLFKPNADISCVWENGGAFGDCIRNSGCEELHVHGDHLYSPGDGEQFLNNAFSNCSALKRATFYQKTIGRYTMEQAVQNDTDLTSLQFPELEVLSNNWALQQMCLFCSALPNVEFPKLHTMQTDNTGGANHIMSDTFYGCSSLTSMSFPVLSACSNTVFAKEPEGNGGDWQKWDSGLLWGCPQCKTMLFSAKGAHDVSALDGYAERWGSTVSDEVSIVWWVGQNEVVPPQYFNGSLSGYRPTGTEILSGTENIHRLSSQAMQRFAVKSTVSAVNGHLDFSNLQYVGDGALMSAFTSCEGISSITIGSPDVPGDTNGRQIYGQNTSPFAYMPDLEEVSVGFKSLDNNWTQSNSTAWQRQGKWFSDCPKLRKAVFTELDHLSARHQTNRNYTIDPLFGWFARSSISCVEFPKLSWIKAQSGTVSYIFTGCSNLVSVEFPALTSVEEGWTTDQPLDCLAHGAPNLSLLSFPCLSVMTSHALNDMLVDAPGVTTLRFPAGISATLTAQEQYSSKFGSPNSSTISVFCGEDLIYPVISEPEPEPEPEEPTDSDGDGLPDWDEVNSYNTSPNLTDTDGDGYSDGEEVQAGTNPNDPDNNPGNQNPGGEGGM